MVFKGKNKLYSTFQLLSSSRDYRKLPNYCLTVLLSNNFITEGDISSLFTV